MTGLSKSRLLTDMRPAQVSKYLERDQRIIVPTGACDQYGPHLPLGAATLVSGAFATRLAEDFYIIYSPTLPYGVNVPSERAFAGAASLREKSLHSLLNDVLGYWEDDGFREFILLTVHDFDSHAEALANVTLSSARVRVLELLNIDLTTFTEGEAGPDHGGETLTSLMLYLYPERVDMDLAVDFAPVDKVVSTLRRLPKIPEESPGSMGYPTLATAAKGKKVFDHIYERVRHHLLTDEGMPS